MMVLSSVRFGLLLMMLVGTLAIWAGGQRAANAQTYESDALPPGVLAAELEDVPINLEAVPVITDPQPVISGQVAQSGGTVEIVLAPQMIALTADVSGDGSFAEQVPQPLEEGQHSLYFDGALVGQFMVAGESVGPTPIAPSAGSGSPVDGWPGGGNASVLLALGGGLLAASSVVIARSLRRRPRL